MVAIRWGKESVNTKKRKVEKRITEGSVVSPPSFKLLLYVVLYNPYCLMIFTKVSD